MGEGSRTLALTNETVIAHGATNTIARAQDNLGRPSGIDLGNDYEVACGYAPHGHFASVTASIESTGSMVSNTTTCPNAGCGPQPKL